MKKIVLSFIVILLTFFITVNAVSAASLDAYWVSYNADKIVNENGTIKISDTKVDDYYLINVSSIEGNTLSVDITGNIFSTDSNFKDFEKDIINPKVYDSYHIIKATSSSIEFNVSYTNYKIAIFEKNYFNDALEINNQSLLQDDLTILNVNASYINLDHNKLVTIGVGSDFGLKAYYAYIYSNDKIDENGILLLEDAYGDTHQLDYDLVSSSNNLYKLQLDYFDSDFFRNNDNFIVRYVGCKDQLITRGFFDNLVNSVVSFFEKDGEIYYHSLDQMKKTINAEYYYVDLTEDIQLFGYTAETNTRLHYVLFDFLLDNEKVDKRHYINSIEVEYNTNNYIPENWPDRTKNAVLDEIEKKGYNYFDLKQHNNFIEPQNKTFELVPSITNPKDYFDTIFNNNRDTYQFKTLARYDDKDLTNHFNVSFRNFDYCIYLDVADDSTYIDKGQDISFFQFQLTDLLFPVSALIKNKAFLPTQVTDIEFISIDFEYNGTSYHATIDETNLEYKGLGGFIGDYIPGDNDSNWYVYVFIIVIIIIAIIVLCIFCPAIIPYLVDFIIQASIGIGKLLVAIISLPLILINSIKDKKNIKKKKTKSKAAKKKK